MKIERGMSLKKIGLRANLTITAVLLSGKKLRRKLRTPPGRLLTPSDIEGTLKIEADRLEQFFPGREFRLVPLRDGNFNFVEIPKDADSLLASSLHLEPVSEAQYAAD